MNNSKRYFILIEIILGSLVIVCIFLMLQNNTLKEQKKVSVIIQNSGDQKWNAFKYGMKMAAIDQNINLSIVSTGADFSSDDVIKLMQQEVRSGTDAIIIQPPNKTAPNEMLKKVKQKIPIMLVEGSATDSSANMHLPVTTSDNYDIGKALQKEVLKDYNGDLEGKTIGFYISNVKSQALIDRKKGFEDGLLDKKVITKWVLFDDKEQTEIQNQERVDIVIALDDESVVSAGACAKKNNLHGAVVYGIGTSMNSIYYLDTKLVKCLIVPDEFNIGYQSVTEVEKKLSNRFISMKSKIFLYSILRHDTIFTKENQKLLFELNPSETGGVIT